MSDERKTLTLTRQWGPHPAGTTLGVLLPRENPGPGLVDPQRAAQLERDGFLAAPAPAGDAEPTIDLVIQSDDEAAPEPVEPQKPRRGGRK